MRYTSHLRLELGRGGLKLKMMPLKFYGTIVKIKNKVTLHLQKNSPYIPL